MYADLVTRLIAFVIDAILLGIVNIFVGIALGAFFAGFLLGGNLFMSLILGVILAVASMVVSAIYFVWGWTNPQMRASLGQRALGLNTVAAADGATLTRDVAIRRWVYLYGVFAVASALQFGLSGSSLAALSPLISLLSLAYVIFLLWTTSQDAKRQGFHDKQAGTVVIKPVR
jgi:uncharacterized RDD family membrane protein YckC